MDYWTLLKPIWDDFPIYGSAREFRTALEKQPKLVQTLMCTHWCRSEVANGGFRQLFFNSTGVMTLEAVQGFLDLGMPLTAASIEVAVKRLGHPYPVERKDRKARLYSLGLMDPFSFVPEDEAFFAVIDHEAGGYLQVADGYATDNS